MKSSAKKGFKFILGINLKRFIILISQTIVVFCFIALLNLFGIFLKNKFALKFDFWPGKVSTLSPQTKNYLRNYDRKIKFLIPEPSYYKYMDPNFGENVFDEILQDVIASNSNFTFEKVYIRKEKELENKLKGVELVDFNGRPALYDGSIIIIDETDIGRNRGVFLCLSNMVNVNVTQFDDELKLRTFGLDNENMPPVRMVKPVSQEAFLFERSLIGALAKLSNKNLIRVAAVSGHGENDFAMNQSFFDNIGVKIEKVNLNNAELSPENQLLFISAPKTDFSKEEIEKLEAFLNGGGKLVYFDGVSQKKLDNLDQFLKVRGIEFSDGFVVNVGGEKPSSLIKIDLNNQNNAYTEKMVERKFPLILGGCRPVNLNNAQDGWQNFEVCRTPNTCILATKENVSKMNELKNGPKSDFIVAGGAQKALESGKIAKVVAVSSTNFFNGAFTKDDKNMGRENFNSFAFDDDTGVARYMSSNSNFIYSLLKETSGQNVFDYVPAKVVSLSSSMDFGFDGDRKLSKEEVKFKGYSFSIVVLCLPFLFLIMAFVMGLVRRRKK